MNAHKGWHQRRYLPHLDAAVVVQHVTFRLHGSLPASVLQRLKADAGGADYQAAVDEELDRGAGPRWLAIPDCAAIVADALHQFDGQRYELLAWCVMPNHVHVLIRQREGWPLGAVVKSWKAWTARMINRRLERSGPFWAADYFDRFARNEAQVISTIRYIEANPVKAGLCQDPEDWPFSSAAPDRGPSGPQTVTSRNGPTQDRGPSGPQSPTNQPADLKVRDPFHSDR